MANKKPEKDRPDIMTRTNYEVLDQWEEDGKTHTLIRNTYNGERIVCIVPHHTEEENRKIAADLTRAMFQMCGVDPYQFETIRITL